MRGCRCSYAFRGANGRSLSASGQKPECVEFGLNGDFFKSRRFESGGKRGGIDSHKRVTDVDEAEQPAVDAVSAEKRSSGFQDAPHFSKKLVLQRRTGDRGQDSELNPALQSAIGGTPARRVSI